MADRIKHPYITRFFRAEDATVNNKDSYCYLSNVTVTADIGDLYSGDTFPWAVMTFNLYSNEMQLDCYSNYIDWREGKKSKAKIAKVQAL